MMDILEEARDVLHQEAQGIEKLIPTLDQNFVNAVNLILQSGGRVIVTGMGKSGHIARKVAATLSSTGTPSIFLHPAEGIHGDLGMVTADDIVLAFSNSGETVEILNTLPSLKRIGAKLIAVVGNHNSTLAKHADIILDASVEKEACPLGLAPTTSTTVSLALGECFGCRSPYATPLYERTIRYLPSRRCPWQKNCCSPSTMSCIKARIIRSSPKTAAFRTPCSS